MYSLTFYHSNSLQALANNSSSLSKEWTNKVKNIARSKSWLKRLKKIQNFRQNVQGILKTQNKKIKIRK